MPPETSLDTESIGTAPTSEATCMFCQAPLRDEGEAFLLHLDESPACRDGYRQWLANLDLDRPSG